MNIHHSNTKNLKEFIEVNRDYEHTKSLAIARDQRTLEWIKIQREICRNNGYILQPGTPIVKSKPNSATSKPSSASSKPTTPQSGISNRMKEIRISTSPRDKSHIYFK